MNFAKERIYASAILQRLIRSKSKLVSLVPSTLTVTLPRFCRQNVQSGIYYNLNCLLEKYDDSLGGIIIGYKNVRILEPDDPDIPVGRTVAFVKIKVDFYVFKPQIGSILRGRIIQKSSTHISCLVHENFEIFVLRPPSVPFENWICEDLIIGDKVVLQVIEIGVSETFVYLEGAVVGVLSSYFADLRKGEIVKDIVERKGYGSMKKDDENKKDENKKKDEKNEKDEKKKKDGKNDDENNVKDQDKKDKNDAKELKRKKGARKPFGRKVIDEISSDEEWTYGKDKNEISSDESSEGVIGIEKFEEKYNKNVTVEECEEKFMSLFAEERAMERMKAKELSAKGCQITVLDADDESPPIPKEGSNNEKEAPVRPKTGPGKKE